MRDDGEGVVVYCILIKKGEFFKRTGAKRKIEGRLKRGRKCSFEEVSQQI